MAKHYIVKKKTEFSKKLLIALLVISFLFTAMSYVLAWFDKNTVETLSAEILRIIWTTDGIGVLSYSVLNATRTWSLNKYGKSGTPSEEEIDEHTKGRGE